MVVSTDGRELVLSRALEVSLRFLQHDFGLWHARMLAAEDEGHYGWPGHAPPLSSFGPSRFVVEDPRTVCARGIGDRIEEFFHGDWELACPVSRALPGEHQAV